MKHEISFIFEGPIKKIIFFLKNLYLDIAQGSMFVSLVADYQKIETFHFR